MPMPAYETDQEQMEMLRKWFKENGRWLLTAIVFGILAAFGWHIWQKQNNQRNEQASSLYEQLLTANEQNNPQTINEMSEEIVKRYPKTEYAALATLIAAKTAIYQNNNSGALNKLQWVIDHSASASLRQIARLRRARVQLSQNQPDEAQKTLSIVNDKTYQPAIDEVQGDIYSAKGDSAKARQYYQSAQSGFSSLLGEDMLLSLKIAQ
jgi:predicted negative regulator of RcsB-dependent stress response